MDPGPSLYNRVLGGLRAGGFRGLAAWCRENGESESTCRAALYGMTNSSDAQSLRARLMRDAGLIEGDQQVMATGTDGGEPN